MEIAYWAQEQQTTFASPAWADGVSAQEEMHSDSLAYTWTQSPIKKKDLNKNKLMLLNM